MSPKFHSNIFFPFQPSIIHFIANVIRINCVLRNRLLAIFPEGIVNFGADFFSTIDSSFGTINKIEFVWMEIARKKANECWVFIYAKRKRFLFFPVRCELKMIFNFQSMISSSSSSLGHAFALVKYDTSVYVMVNLYETRRLTALCQCYFFFFLFCFHRSA